MSKKLDTAKSIAKLAGQVSVQMMLGGLSAAVMPPTIGIPFKIIYFAGSCIVASCAKNPVDKAVEEGFDSIIEAYETTKKNIEILRS